MGADRLGRHCQRGYQDDGDGRPPHAPTLRSCPGADHFTLPLDKRRSISGDEDALDREQRVVRGGLPVAVGAIVPELDALERLVGGLAIPRACCHYFRSRMARVAIERTRQVAASPATVWRRCYADADAWPEWNPELASATLPGALQVGATARVRFRAGLRLRFRITECEPDRVFTDEARMPGARMGHRHALEPSGTATLLRNTIYFDGPLARTWAWLMSRRAAAALEEGQRRIAELAAGAAP